MYSGQVLEYRDLGINFDTFELCDTKRLDSEQPGNSEPFFDDKFAYLLYSSNEIRKTQNEHLIMVCKNFIGM